MDLIRFVVAVVNYFAIFLLLGVVIIDYAKIVVAVDFFVVVHLNFNISNNIVVVVAAAAAEAIVYFVGIVDIDYAVAVVVIYSFLIAHGIV
jgi:hypothetical protein